MLRQVALRKLLGDGARVLRIFQVRCVEGQEAGVVVVQAYTGVAKAYCEGDYYCWGSTALHHFNHAQRRLHDCIPDASSIEASLPAFFSFAVHSGALSTANNIQGHTAG